MDLKSQKYSRKAFECVKKRENSDKKDKYLTFAKRFPSLIHTCGLAQAIAFAQSKVDYKPNFEDLQDIFKETEDTPSLYLITKAQEVPLSEYLRLSRDAIAVTGWIKKYAEALLDKQQKKQ